MMVSGIKLNSLTTHNLTGNLESWPRIKRETLAKVTGCRAAQTCLAVEDKEHWRNSGAPLRLKQSHHMGGSKSGAPNMGPLEQSEKGPKQKKKNMDPKV